MERLAAKPGSTGAPPSSSDAELAGYVKRVVGPGATPPVVERVVSEIAAPADLDDAALERARDATLREVERVAASARRRLARLAKLRFGCGAVPGMLAARGSGRTTSADAARLHRHLDRCPDCAELTRRFDAAEWQLHSGPASAPSGVRPQAGWRAATLPPPRRATAAPTGTHPARPLPPTA
ncbi:MAG: hypothetical protein ACR2KV_11315, partial [Solirubrobacteraceae bacterium]